jgi:hypothetical protein
MLQGISSLLSSPAGLVGLIGTLVLVVLLLDRNYRIARPVSHITGLGEKRTEAVMRIVITLAVLGSCLYIILSEAYGPETQKWAFGMVGTLFGAWLPSKPLGPTPEPPPGDRASH